MQKSKKIIVKISFNEKNQNNFRKQKSWTKSWINKRMGIFMDLTARSLEKQTNQEFTALVLYSDRTESLIQQALKKYKTLPATIKFIKHSLFEHNISKAIKGYKYLYLVRIDSDDLYRKNYVQQLHDYKHKRDTKALINQRGYMYDKVGERIAPMYAKSPPFYTLIYRTEDFLNGVRYRPRGGHPGAIYLRHQKLSGSNFVHVIHSGNTTSKFRSKRNKIVYNHKAVSGKRQVNKILSAFM